MKRLVDELALLLHLLAGLLPLEDGILALHFRPAQCAVGQVANNHRQLADLRVEEQSNCLIVLNNGCNHLSHPVKILVI